MNQTFVVRVLTHRSDPPRHYPTATHWDIQDGRLTVFNGDVAIAAFADMSWVSVEYVIKEVAA